MAGQLPVFHPDDFYIRFTLGFSVAWYACFSPHWNGYLGSWRNWELNAKSPLHEKCWNQLGITNYANALCISVSPTGPPMSRLVSDIPISLLISYFSIVDLSSSIKTELFSFVGIVAKSWLNHGKLENQNKLLYFHSWGWNKWVSSFEGDEDDKIKYENGDDPWALI